MILTRDDDNARRTVSVGEEIVVRLPETPTTGYQWFPEVDEEVLEAVADGYDAVVMPRGAPGLHTYAFRARRPGSTVLRLVQRRPWESRVVKEYRVELDVAG